MSYEFVDANTIESETIPKVNVITNIHNYSSCHHEIQLPMFVLMIQYSL
jgi:hypothetical protein